MSERKAEYLQAADGTYPCADWLDDLDKSTRARIKANIDKVCRGLRKPVKALDDGVFEIKIDHGPGYRIYFGEEGAKFIILLLGGDKKTQVEDIRKAKELWRSYETNKKL